MLDRVNDEASPDAGRVFVAEYVRIRRTSTTTQTRARFRLVSDVQAAKR